MAGSRQLTSYTDAETTATPLALMKMAVHGDANALSQLPDTMSLFLGNNPGCIGEVSALALLLGLVYMLWKRLSPGIFRFPFWQPYSYSLV